jgi:ABC-2 type transport system ATP-binding protein
MDSPVVEVSDVYKTFVTHHFFALDEETQTRRIYKKNVVHAAKGISFNIQRGEVFGLLGPNGAGKTTTVKMICGLVTPDRGRVRIDGMDTEKHRSRVLRKVGVVLEGTRTSIWPLTPLENLYYYGNLKDVRGKVLRRRAHELLDFIGLRDKKNVQVRRLSRGQKQKLAICIALISDPQILLLDEPTTGLDVQSSRAIKDKIREMTTVLGKSVLVTTHDMYVAQELCDRIGIIHQGELITCRPTADLIGVFSEYVFVFTVNRSVGLEPIRRISGVLSATQEQEDQDTRLVVTLSEDPQQRSQAFYALMDELKSQHIEVHAVSQRKTTLESVFLQLTHNTESTSPSSITQG